MLDDLVDVHAQDLRSPFRDVDEVTDEIDDPVQDHEADDHGDGDDVNILNNVGSRCQQTLTTDTMNWVRCHFLGDVRVALAARCAQVPGVDGRGRVRARQNAMDAVARSAVGDVGVAGLRFETVIGIDKRRQSARPDPVLLVEHRRLVARRAGHLRDLGAGDGR